MRLSISLADASRNAQGFFQDACKAIIRVDYSRAAISSTPSSSEI